LFDLGKKQNGLGLNDVILPAWSKNDCREFIRIHRMVKIERREYRLIERFFLGFGK
jgi:hypothetical protein